MLNITDDANFDWYKSTKWKNANYLILLVSTN